MTQYVDVSLAQQSVVLRKCLDFTVYFDVFKLPLMRVQNGAMTISRMTLSRVACSRMVWSRVTFNIMTFSKISFSKVKLTKMTIGEWHFAE